MFPESIVNELINYIAHFVMKNMHYFGCKISKKSTPSLIRGLQANCNLIKE